jgi:hypothetical protein
MRLPSLSVSAALPPAPGAQPPTPTQPRRSSPRNGMINLYNESCDAPGGETSPVTLSLVPSGEALKGGRPGCVMTVVPEMTSEGVSRVDGDGGRGASSGGGAGEVMTWDSAPLSMVSSRRLHTEQMMEVRAPGGWGVF